VNVAKIQVHGVNSDLVKPMARPFKVLIPEQKKQFGVVARNLRLLRDDIQKRYGFKNFKICLPDGTTIDDEEYFTFLEPQTLLIVRRDNSIPDTLISGKLSVFSFSVLMFQ